MRLLAQAGPKGYGLIAFAGRGLVPRGDCIAERAMKARNALRADGWEAAWAGLAWCLLDWLLYWARPSCWPKAPSHAHAFFRRRAQLLRQHVRGLTQEYARDLTRDRPAHPLPKKRNSPG